MSHLAGVTSCSSSRLSGTSTGGMCFAMASVRGRRDSNANLLNRMLRTHTGACIPFPAPEGRGHNAKREKTPFINSSIQRPRWRLRPLFST
eukprot:1159241-Pelagomonas_calceolata.AAC.2